MNLQVASVSFMDEAFGHLALEYSEQELRSKLAFKNMSEFDRALLNDIIASRIRERVLKNRGKTPILEGTSEVRRKNFQGPLAR